MHPPDDHLIRVEPSGLQFFARHGESVMSAALRNGVSWPSACDRVGDCRACVLWVPVDESENLSSIGTWEQSNLDAGRLRADVDRRQPRLACQAEVLGDVKVTRRGVRRDESAGGRFPTRASDPKTAEAANETGPSARAGLNRSFVRSASTGLAESAC